jgi:hypothetical protein
MAYRNGVITADDVTLVEDDIKEMSEAEKDDLFLRDHLVFVVVK